MGKKKPSDPTQVQGKIATVSGSTSLFDTLFGNVGVENSGVAIFSSDNPFRRNPKALNSDSVTQKSPNGRSNNVIAGDEKDREKGKEKNLVTGLEISRTSSRIKKSTKKEKSLDPALSSRDIEDGEGMKLASADVLKNKSKGFGSGSERVDVLREGDDEALKSNSVYNKELNAEEVMGLKLNATKKKRKRDEIEREYEAKKYGVSDLGEEREEGLGSNAVGKKRKALEDPSKMLVTKEGFDDESKLLRTVFVGNLPLKVKKKALTKEFSQFGEIESVRIRSVPLANSKKPRKGAILSKRVNESADSAHAYVVFKTEESAQASLSHNMAVIAGNHIRVDRACPPRKKLKAGNAPIYDHKRTVFVGNLPFDVKDEELYKLFCGMENLASSVEAVRVIRDPHVNIGKGFAYVFFKTKEAAQTVVRKQKLELRDRVLRLFHAKPNSTLTPSKKRNRLPTESDHTPVKRLASDSGSRTPGSSKRATPVSTASYQGLRASKSGSNKKNNTKISSLKRPKSYSNSSEKPLLDQKRKRSEKATERKRKRPSVANRKAEAIGLKSNGAPKGVAGVKRKTNGTTPDSSSHRSKRVKKFK